MIKEGGGETERNRGIDKKNEPLMQSGWSPLLVGKARFPEQLAFALKVIDVEMVLFWF